VKLAEKSEETKTKTLRGTKFLSRPKTIQKVLVGVRYFEEEDQNCEEEQLLHLVCRPKNTREKANSKKLNTRNFTDD
jgi:hypothetical protein